MRRPRIFTEQQLAANSQFQLERGPSQHLARSLRMGPGDFLSLFSGSGGEYPAEIVAVDKTSVTVSTKDLVEGGTESPLSVHLGIAVSRGERMDWVVQKATELGVASITPLFTERTEVKLKGERAEKKLRHWQQVAISACEQCGRNVLPRISGLSMLETWATSVQAERRFVLHHRADGWSGGNAPSSIALLIGPEGGLSEGEIELAERAGFAPMQLGPRVLRTETAPLAALAILQATWGDMG